MDRIPSSQPAKLRPGGALYEYERVAMALGREIEAGQWPPGTVLPSIPELMERFGVSRGTIRGGLDELQHRGLVYAGYGDGRHGSIVKSRDRLDVYATDALRGSVEAFAECAAQIGKAASTDFSMRIASAPRDVTAALGVDVWDLVVARTLDQLVDGELWAREVGFYPMDLAKKVGLDTPSIIPHGAARALADAGYREVAYLDAVVHDAADPDDARDFRVSGGAPLLRQTRIAATEHRVTRVMKYTRLAEHHRVVWEVGDASGIDVIRRNLESPA